MSAFPWFSDLAEHLADGSLALWVGGDVPQTLIGVPTCQALAADLAQRYGLATGLPLAEVAQRLARRGQRWEFTDFLQRTLGAADHGPQSWHALLASLPVSHFIATAYDDLLARALRAGSRPFDHLVQAGQVALRTPRAVGLIQLYGWVAQPDTLVVTENDHLQLWENAAKKALLDRVRHSGGASSADSGARPDRSHVQATVGQHPGPFRALTPAAYAVAPGLSMAAQAVWEDRHIHILEAAPLAVVERLHELGNRPQSM
ncbi:SIR2 family protein [Candidatus Amarolinea dominans]|uniref:SIR2 family protein n=1 Tax=Candidatus Amarolinea dominans TaxID=3140696 RepID=UPI001D3AC5A3|nr:SIR2 family protein [Anaerolineae bacterium]